MEIYKNKEYQQFIEWTATPPALRTINDQRKLALQLGVHESTLSDWKKIDGFWESVDKLINTWGRSRTSDVIDALYKKIMTCPKASDIKLWLEYFGDFKTNSKLTIENNSAKEQSNKLDNILAHIMGVTK